MQPLIIPTADPGVTMKLTRDRDRIVLHLIHCVSNGVGFSTVLLTPDNAYLLGNALTGIASTPTSGTPIAAEPPTD